MDDLTKARLALKEMRARHKAEVKPLVKAVNTAAMAARRKGHKAGRISGVDHYMIQTQRLFTNDPKLLAAGALPLTPEMVRQRDEEIERRAIEDKIERDLELEE